MSFDNLTNLIALLATIVGLLYAVSGYIEKPGRSYRLILAFFLANFLSDYFWTIYELLIGDSPAVSDFAAYLGWNIGYLVLLLATILLRSPGAKRYLHPLMFLPILINIPQFLQYISFGGILNNCWQVGLTTAAAVFCLQDLLYYLKFKVKCPAFPWFSLIVLVFLTLQYATWTSSCFDWPSDPQNPYYYFAILSSLTRLFFPYGARKHFEAQESRREAKTAAALRAEVLTRTVLSLVIVGICAVGFFAALWIKNSLIVENGAILDDGRIVVWLFAISAAMILLVMALLYAMTSRFRHLLENRGAVTSGHRSRLNFFVTLAVTLALMLFAVVYNSVTLYDASVISVYEDGEEAIKSTATEIENYLTVASTSVRVVADTVDLMAENGRSTEDIRRYLVDQTTRLAEKFDENFTGLYAYVDGEYLDGLEWVPPEGYEPTERDWYILTTAAGGEVVIVPPYVDAQTGSVVLTFGRGLTSSEDGSGLCRNTVCLDVIVNHVDDVVSKVSVAGKGYGLLVDSDGLILAHRDNSFVGQTIVELYGQELFDSIRGADESMITAELDGENCVLFVAPVMQQWTMVIVVGSSELLSETYSQLAVNIVVSLITFCLISFFYYIGYKNEQISGKKVQEMNLQVVSALATAIDAKDRYTNGHSTRVAEYARMLAARSGASDAEQNGIYMMGLLHDVGKIGIPDSVINKPGPLSAEEYELIKKHPAIGSEILEVIKDRPRLATAARWHHERYGGGGYPDGIAGEAIPIEARIIAVADAYDAMTSRRSYRDIMPQDKVRSEIEKGAGTQFDPRLAGLMLEMIDEDGDYSMREK